MTRDDYLIGHVRDALASSPDVGALDLHVEIRGQQVFLSGTIDCESKREAATEVARRTAPAHDVVNNINVYKLLPVEPAEVLHDSSGGRR